MNKDLSKKNDLITKDFKRINNKIARYFYEYGFISGHNDFIIKEGYYYEIKPDLSRFIKKKIINKSLKKLLLRYYFVPSTSKSTSLSIFHISHTICMNQCKGNEPLNQNSSSQKNNTALSIQEQKTLTAFFLLLLEIDQQNNVMKECSDAKQTE